MPPSDRSQSGVRTASRVRWTRREDAPRRDAPVASACVCVCVVCLCGAGGRCGAQLLSSLSALSGRMDVSNYAVTGSYAVWRRVRYAPTHPD